MDRQLIAQYQFMMAFPHCKGQVVIRHGWKQERVDETDDQDGQLVVEEILVVKRIE
jgi:hypothetical protein